MNIDEQILFTPEDEDIPFFFHLLNDWDSQRIVGGDCRPFTMDKVRCWLLDKVQDPHCCIYSIKYHENFCGYVQLTSINHLNGHAILGINLLPESRGKGIGRKAMTHIHQFAKQFLCLRKIALYVRSDNKSAISLYTSLGYHQVGVLKEHIRSVNGFIDLIIMEIFL